MAAHGDRPEYLSPENRVLHQLMEERNRLHLLEPEKYLWLLPPCRVRILLVADGGLDFSLGPFGLRTFVETLKSSPYFYVRFDITVAHIDDVSDDAVMLGHAGIVRSIKRFKFDDPSHFAPTMYDQVWLFGIDTSYSRGANAAGTPYPSTRLADAELKALSQFMDGGGGLFATGDHGALGICLSGSVPRARSMRLWNDTSPDNAINEVSMSGPRRNDTNRLGGSPGSQFDDQSDDIPQTIQPRLYFAWGSWWRYWFPHPLLCGPRGMIRVLPDHPHEGQCVTPTNAGRSDTFAGYTIVEYPGGLGRPLPEVVATSTVLSGTTSGSKAPTETHSFGAIGAYNGHAAGVGRVVTDATWHHFVNINLVGDSTAPPGDPKRLGFLATPSGQAHFEEIKAYYRNIAIWLSPSSRLACMRRRICWGLLWHHRVMESVMTRPEIALRKATLPLLFDIGRHARDVLGLYAGRCQSRRFAIDLLQPLIERPLLARLDPWEPPPGPRPPRPEPDPIPWFDPEPILDAAVGGAMVSLREAFGHPARGGRPTDEAIDRAVGRGVAAAAEMSVRSVTSSGRAFLSQFHLAKSTRGKVSSPRRRNTKARSKKS